MSYNFVPFVNTNAKIDDRITVTKSNSFGFPYGFFRKNELGSYKYVTLFYDAEKKAVGFHFTNDETIAHKYTIVKNPSVGGGGTGGSGSIVAKSFFRTYNIDCKTVAGRYEPVQYEQEGSGKIFVIELKESAEETPIEGTPL